MVWQEQHLRFRPNQITQFKEEYPDKSLSVVMRMLLDEFLGGQKDNISRISEIEEILKTKEREVRLLNIEHDELVDKRNVEMSNIELASSRNEYLEKNPIVLEMFKLNTISSTGYKKLVADLGFKNKGQVIEWLKGCMYVD